MRKHRVSFEVAMRVFSDPLVLARQDRFEGGERRWTTIGLVDGQVLLVVAHILSGRRRDRRYSHRLGKARRTKERSRYEKADR
jgi:uncharacterized DUF497 family protein